MNDKEYTYDIDKYTIGVDENTIKQKQAYFDKFMKDSESKGEK